VPAQDKKQATTVPFRAVFGKSAGAAIPIWTSMRARGLITYGSQRRTDRSLRMEIAGHSKGSGIHNTYIYAGARLKALKAEIDASSTDSGSEVRCQTIIDDGERPLVARRWGIALALMVPDRRRFTSPRIGGQATAIIASRCRAR